MATSTSSRALAPIGVAGNLFAFALDVFRGLFRRPFQLREFIQQAWFIASVNPARSTSQAVFVRGWALTGLWLFWVAPILGAMLAGFVYSWLGDDEVPPAEPVVGENASTTVVEVIEE